MFTVEAGDELLADFPYLGVAIEDAMKRLEEDPEMGNVEVYGRVGDNVTYVGRATAVPNEQWESVVGWVWANAKIPAPSLATTEAMTDDEFESYINDAYGDDWAKREGMRQMREDGLA